MGDKGTCCVKGCFLTEPERGIYLLSPLMQGCCVLTELSEKPLLVLTELPTLISRPSDVL